MTSFDSKFQADVHLVLLRKSDKTVPLTEQERLHAILKLEQHINSFPLLNFDDVTISVRMHFKGDINNEKDDSDVCTLDTRHPQLRCG